MFVVDICPISVDLFDFARVQEIFFVPPPHIKFTHLMDCFIKRKKGERSLGKTIIKGKKSRVKNRGYCAKEFKLKWSI